MEETNRRLAALETDVRRLRGQRRGLVVAILVGVAALALLGPGTGQARGRRAAVEVGSDDGRFLSVLTPHGLTVSVDGKPRLRAEASENYSGITFLGDRGNVTFDVASSEAGTAVKIFADDENLRVELAETLLDSGSGLRLYDNHGFPRATLFAQRRGGASGLELTDADRQPRVDIYARPDGSTVIRAADGDATALAELSVLPRSDLAYRRTGVLPEPSEGEPVVPMLFLAGNGTVITAPE